MQLGFTSTRKMQTYWRESSGRPLRCRLEPMIYKESLGKLFSLEEAMAWRGLSSFCFQLSKGWL